MNMDNVMLAVSGALGVLVAGLILELVLWVRDARRHRNTRGDRLRRWMKFHGGVR